MSGAPTASAGFSQVVGRCWRHSGVTIPIAGSYTDTSQMPRTCPTCNGTGINPVATYLLCPKCNGKKVVPAS